MGVNSRISAMNTWLNDPIEPDWQRPAPTSAQKRNDVVGAGCFVVVALIASVAATSADAVYSSRNDEPVWHTYIAIAVIIVPLAVRRRVPLTTVLISSVLFVSMTYFAQDASPQLSFQVAYFAALYTAVAWTRDRRMLWFAMGLVLLTMMLWVGVLITQMHAADMNPGNSAHGSHGPWPPLAGAAIYTIMVNLAYFGGAILIGRASWRGALHRYRSERQAVTIAEQADELARTAVHNERLRIARELHDVVAHHVSTIGVQASAARTVLSSDPQATARSLHTIEESSRQAVGEMRDLLGVLRSENGADADDGAGRVPEPGINQLHELVASYQRTGRLIELAHVEQHDGDLDGIGSSLSLSTYRIVQEALVNVQRHSTAQNVRITLRTAASSAHVAAQSLDAQWLEIEVVDDGRPRAGTGGSGYGLRGVQERVNLHHGTYEAGPRESARGWRVRVRIPLREN